MESYRYVLLSSTALCIGWRKLGKNYLSRYYLIHFCTSIKYDKGKLANKGKLYSILLLCIDEPFIFTDKTDDWKAADTGIIWWSLPKHERCSSSLWSTLYTLLGHVLDRLVIHRGRHSQCYRRGAHQLLQDANGMKLKDVLAVLLVSFGDNAYDHDSQFVIFQVAHVIREIQLFQQTPYRIEHHKRVRFVLSVSNIIQGKCIFENLLLQFYIYNCRLPTICLIPLDS